MNKKILAAGVIMTALLAGCADQTALTHKVDQLSQDVAALQSDVTDTKVAANEALAESQKANQRIDAIRGSYRK